MPVETRARLSELYGDLNRSNHYTLLVDKVPSDIGEVPFTADTPPESKGFSGFFLSEDRALEAAKTFLGNVTNVTEVAYPGFAKYEIYVAA